MHVEQVYPTLYIYSYCMKHIVRKLFFFLLLFCNLTVFGKERYHMRILPDGKMYFFMPCKLKGSSGAQLQYDMTLISYRDSVSINMTLTSSIGRVERISLLTPEVSYSTQQYELFYQERNGARFNTRVHIDCPMAIYRKLFTGLHPITIKLMMDDGKQYAFVYKAKNWKKEASYVFEVLEMIAYSNSRK